MMDLKVSPEHRWLSQLVGDWIIAPPPGTADAAATDAIAGSESVRMIGEIWLLAEGVGRMPNGGDYRQLMTLGFDPQTGRFVGTWIGSMMNTFWVYDGDLDMRANELTLHCEGPFFDEPNRLTKYRDIITIHGPNHRSLRGMILTREGTWELMHSVSYVRC